jgi:hypothetical protein
MASLSQYKQKKEISSIKWRKTLSFQMAVDADMTKGTPLSRKEGNFGQTYLMGEKVVRKATTNLMLICASSKIRKTRNNVDNLKSRARNVSQ